MKGTKPDAERRAQLEALAAEESDNAECAAADLHKEFPAPKNENKT